VPLGGVKCPSIHPHLVLGCLCCWSRFAWPPLAVSHICLRFTHLPFGPTLSFLPSPLANFSVFPSFSASRELNHLEWT
jgi:hypothetical protein